MGQEALNFEQMESAGFTFLISDLELGLTFVHIATKSAKDIAKKTRNQRNARRAYDTVQEFASRMALTGAHRREFDRKSARLKSALEKLGELF
jgi:hypothetical protein